VIADGSDAELITIDIVIRKPAAALETVEALATGSTTLLTLADPQPEAARTDPAARAAVHVARARRRQGGWWRLRGALEAERLMGTR
jgi:hypothetical protein